MTIESATHVSDLNSSYPAAGDAKSEGDDHIRLIKTVVKTDVSTLSASASTTLSTVTAVSTVAANVSTSLGNVSTSLGNVSTSLGNVSTSLGNVSTSLGNVSTSNANVSTSLSTNTSTLTAVSSTVATYGGAPAMIFVSSQTASSSASITFTGLASGYDYVLYADGLTTSGGDAIRARLQVSGVDETGAVYHASGSQVNGGSLTVVSDTSGTAFTVSGISSYSAGSASGFEFRLQNPAGTVYRVGSSRSSAWTGAGAHAERNADILFASTSAVDGVKIYPAAGTIDTGVFRLYKIARS